MKVHNGFFPVRRALWGAVPIVAFAAILFFSATSVAHAITRDTVLDRAHVWVDKRISYSQSSYYKGYRQDCSGFVSMAWKLDRSYTTRTISSQADRISVGSLKPGDAVLIPGHVSLFGGWKDKKARTYWAIEETTWGSHAKRRVRTVPGNATALRYERITAPQPAEPSSEPTDEPLPSARIAERMADDGEAGIDVSPMLRGWMGIG